MCQDARQDARTESAPHAGGTPHEGPKCPGMQHTAAAKGGGFAELMARCCGGTPPAGGEPGREDAGDRTAPKA